MVSRMFDLTSDDPPSLATGTYGCLADSDPDLASDLAAYPVTRQTETDENNQIILSIPAT